MKAGAASANLHPESCQQVSASLCQLDAVNCAGESRRQDIGLPIDIFGRRYDRFAIAGARFGKNAFAQRDDLFILRERRFETIDRCDVSFDCAPELRREALLAQPPSGVEAGQWLEFNA